jgi:acetylornithine deacetylase/succinyl-diaminopimelate desuccinylase-like protein
MMGTLKVEILTEAVHSGMASGIVPSSFRIIRQLLDRIENAETGKLPAICYAAVPPHNLEEAKLTGDTVGDGVWKKFPFSGQAGPVSKNPGELVLGGTWMPTLCITGVDGMPAIANAGNVLRSYTALRLSMRTPPSVDAKAVAAWFEKELTRDPPYGAKVTFTCDKAQTGWQAPKLAPWLATSLENASQTFYQKPARFTGEGGSIPFMVRCHRRIMPTYA